ncbi:unnamed protein product [Brachionus calyciflorus]|uniref:Uncharacterized protein n=1 Tax=Brachionus calyciflorus TaxID=104777 RepID=A0A813UV73_9BILA|nr:unnamed protein product [Brachionus calyciflorus]
MKSWILISLFLILLCSNESFGILNIIRKEKNNGCDQIVQKAKHSCSKSIRDCRSCCHFDLILYNNRYGEREFYLKDTVLLTSQECVCLICKNYLDNFDNKPFF